MKRVVLVGVLMAAGYLPSNAEPNKAIFVAQANDVQQAFGVCDTAWTGGDNPQISSLCQAACISRVAAELNRQAGQNAAADQFEERADAHCSLLEPYGAIGDCKAC